MLSRFIIKYYNEMLSPIKFYIKKFHWKSQTFGDILKTKLKIILTQFAKNLIKTFMSG